MDISNSGNKAPYCLKAKFFPKHESMKSISGKFVIDFVGHPTSINNICTRSIYLFEKNFVISSNTLHQIFLK